jgi:HK97 family phage prohead protease
MSVSQNDELVFTGSFSLVPKDSSKSYSFSKEVLEGGTIVDTFEFDPIDLDNIENHLKREIKGLANTPILDRANEIVLPSAFDESLPRFMQNPILRLNHKQGEVIGRITSITPSDKGLWVTAKIFKGTPKAEEAWALIVQGGLRSLSIYGKIIDKEERRDMKSGKVIKYVKQFDLHEIAVVDLPANPDSQFKIVSKTTEGAEPTMKEEEKNYF